MILKIYNNRLSNHNKIVSNFHKSKITKININKQIRKKLSLEISFVQNLLKLLKQKKFLLDNSLKELKPFILNKELQKNLKILELKKKYLILEPVSSINLSIFIKFCILANKLPMNLVNINTLFTLSEKKMLKLYYKQVMFNQIKYRISSLSFFIFTKFINCLMLSGKKDLSLKLINKFCRKVITELMLDPFELMYLAVLKVSPPFRLKSKRIAGKNYNIPLYLAWEDQLKYGISIIVKSIRVNKSTNLVDCLIQELLDIIRNDNNSISLKTFNAICDNGIANKYYVKYL